MLLERKLTKIPVNAPIVYYSGTCALALSFSFSASVYFNAPSVNTVTHFINAFPDNGSINTPPYKHATIERGHAILF